MSAVLLTACWPLNPRDDCEQNAALTCFWERFAPASSSGAGGDGGTPAGCVPSAQSGGPVADECGVFVSSSDGDDGGDGSKAKPLKSLAAAVAMAGAKGKPVYACAETFEEALVLDGSVEMFGGLACDSGWKYVGGETKTTLTAGADEIPLVLTSGMKAAWVEDFAVHGEPGAGMWSCIEGAGQIGSSGEAGMAGVGAAGREATSASGYVGARGGAGTSGKAGQGGGGGGGAKGGMICSPGNMTGSGASGGSGGAGGCGGLPGQGGGSGGASIALVSLQASITLTDCTLTAGVAGNGGAGGDAQPGGGGGLPGFGGLGAGISNSGCDGGKGGKGGNGGPGGGGLGGPSLGVAFQGNPPQSQGKTIVTPGTPGEGGPGGSANVAMNQGEAGIAAEQQEFP